MSRYQRFLQLLQMFVLMEVTAQAADRLALREEEHLEYLDMVATAMNLPSDCIPADIVDAVRAFAAWWDDHDSRPEWIPSTFRAPWEQTQQVSDAA